MRPEVAVVAQTYLAIASTMPQVRTEFDGRRVIAQGPFAHPICNFGLVIEPTGLADAIELGVGRPHFNLYTFESSGIADVPGYAPGLAMRLMTSPARDSLEQTMERAESPRTKLQVARFMTEQFFTNQRTDVRERIAEATARAEGMEHFACLQSSSFGEEELVGAAMLAPGTQMAGLFNVTVRADRRRRGLGASIVESMVSEAARQGLATTLQCDLALEGWYADQGFVSVDTMTVWSAAL